MQCWTAARSQALTCRMFYLFSSWSCAVQYEVPPDGDPYPPIQALGCNVSDIVDREWWLKNVMRPIPKPNRSRIRSWTQTRYFHPLHMRRCLSGSPSVH